MLLNVIYIFVQGSKGKPEAVLAFSPYFQAFRVVAISQISPPKRRKGMLFIQNEEDVKKV
jgi:hypothetical protein